MSKEIADLLGLLDGVRGLLVRELECLDDQALNDRVRPDFNSIGMLVRHVADMERHMIGQQVGGIPAGVDSQSAFAVEQATRAELLEQLAAAGTPPEELDADGMRLLSGLVLNKRQTVSYAIAHHTHHRAQIILLRNGWAADVQRIRRIKACSARKVEVAWKHLTSPTPISLIARSSNRFPCRRVSRSGQVWLGTSLGNRTRCW